MKKRLLDLTCMTALFLAADASYVTIKELKRPSLIMTIYNATITPFLTYKQLIKRDFNIECEGDEEAIKNLYNNLTIIKEENPDLLVNVKKIIVKEGVLCDDVVVWGLARNDGTIILKKDYQLYMLAHELAHVEYFKKPIECTVCFLKLLGEPPLKHSSSKYRWFDGKIEPRKGYLSPLTSKSLSETIAHYTETFYYPEEYDFWKETSFDDYDYVRVLEELERWSFITFEQKEKAINALNKKY